MATCPTLLQILADLLRDHKVLDTFEQHLALCQAHAEGLHRQLLPLDSRQLFALFAAVGTHAYYFDPKVHDQNPRRRRVKILKRSLASWRLNRSGSKGPLSLSLRSMLRKPSSIAVRSRSQVCDG